MVIHLSGYQFFLGYPRDLFSGHFYLFYSLTICLFLVFHLKLVYLLTTLRFIRRLNIFACTLLQADLNRLYEWSVTWKMNFNHSKCKILTVSRRKAPVYFNHMLTGNSLELVTSFKDLGVLVSSDLSWKEHIHNVVSKCNRVNGMIRRVVGYHAPNNVALNLYKSLTRSIAEYSTPVWSLEHSNSANTA